MFFTNPRFFSRNVKYVSFLVGCKVSFYVMIYSYIGIFYLKKNFYLVEKQNKENFVKKLRRFVDSGIVKSCDEHNLCDNVTTVIFIMT